MSSFCYENMVQDALLSVVKKSLIEAATHGLTGDHHFYISFKTKFSGVVIPEYLKERHPDEMMVVIQYQFENLQVKEDHFSVGLSFCGKLERLVIPFNAIVAFVDPSVRFGLQFNPVDNGTPGGNKIGEKTDAAEKFEDCKIISFESLKKK